jgi:hypothetical protein
VQELNPTIEIHKSKLVGLNQKYVPETIRAYISDMDQTIVYKVKINNRNLILNLTGINKTQADNYIVLIFTAIHLLSLNVSKKCAKTITINIYYTPFKKEFSTNKSDILGPEHVNSGYSTIGCLDSTEITIYRKEEWFKVLIHELFHNLGLDFANLSETNWVPTFSKTFEIDSEYNIYETYCETWARIISTIFYSFTPSKNVFISNFYKNMGRERLFSLKQANLILKRFENISDYREKSNVFCYYILTAALLEDYLKFFQWCNNNNAILFNFKDTKKNVKSFSEFVITQTTSPCFDNALSCVSKVKNIKNKSLINSLRMTSIDF